MGQMQLNNINLPNRGEIPSGKLTVCELENHPVLLVNQQNQWAIFYVVIFTQGHIDLYTIC
jgi:hypothetical protein